MSTPVTSPTGAVFTPNDVSGEIIETYRHLDRLSDNESEEEEDETVDKNEVLNDLLDDVELSDVDEEDEGGLDEAQEVKGEPVKEKEVKEEEWKEEEWKEEKVKEEVNKEEVNKEEVTEAEAEVTEAEVTEAEVSSKSEEDASFNSKVLQEEPSKETSETSNDETSTSNQPVEEDYDSSDDFGSFDDASFTEEDKAPTITSSPILKTTSISENHTHIVPFTEEVFLDKEQLNKNVDQVVDLIFTIEAHTESKADQSMLSDRSKEIFAELSAFPHLKPPNWTRSKIRHRLLVQLGIPVNLDEWEKKQPAVTNPEPALQPTPATNIALADLDKQYTPEEMSSLMNTTNEILSHMETDNLNNSARQYLEDLADETQIDAKLAQYQDNMKRLLELSSVWNHHLDGLKTDFEMYESIVQNFIGYSQKLKREEMIENLKRAKKSKKKPVW